MALNMASVHDTIIMAILCILRVTVMPITDEIIVISVAAATAAGGVIAIAALLVNSSQTMVNCNMLN